MLCKVNELKSKRGRSCNFLTKKFTGSHNFSFAFNVFQNVGYSLSANFVFWTNIFGQNEQLFSMQSVCFISFL